MNEEQLQQIVKESTAEVLNESLFLSSGAKSMKKELKTKLKTLTTPGLKEKIKAAVGKDTRRYDKSIANRAISIAKNVLHSNFNTAIYYETRQAAIQSGNTTIYTSYNVYLADFFTVEKQNSTVIRCTITFGPYSAKIDQFYEYRVDTNRVPLDVIDFIFSNYNPTNRHALAFRKNKVIYRSRDAVFASGETYKMYDKVKAYLLKSHPDISVTLSKVSSKMTFKLQR